MSAAADKALDLQKGGNGEHPESIYHYELSAKDPETGAGVLVLVNAYSASATDYTSGLQKGAEAEGASYTVGSTETVTLAGRRYLMVPLAMEGQETPYQRQYVRKDGDYLITVMLFAPTDSAEAGKGLKFPKWSRANVTYVLPFIVLVIFAMGYYQKFFQ